MRVYVYPSDLGGCGYYRLIWPAMALRTQGYDVRVVHPDTKNKITGGLTDDDRLVQISAPSDADVMVFQRLTSRHIIDGIDILRDHGVAVVIDVDDDMKTIHPGNPAFDVLHPNMNTKKTSEYNWHNAQRACEKATLVTVSTPALRQRYAPRGNGRVLYNAVPENMTKIVPRPQENVFGWAGSLHIHQDDPRVVGTSAARLQREGWKFKVVGPAHGIRSAFQLDDEPLASGAVPIQHYPHEVTKLSVGLAPLGDTRFNSAKSWLKMLEYAALGVPCVGSPRDEYRRIHDRGIGLLADSPRDWYRHTRRLLNDAELRSEMSATGRQIVIDEMTVEANAWRWWEAWADALNLQRGPLSGKTARATVPDPA